MPIKRAELLGLFQERRPSQPPAFSGLIHVTSDGLADAGLQLHEVHHDARKMAAAASSTFRLTGIPSAALPLDLCAPAEALGAVLNFPADENQFPQTSKPVFASARELDAGSFQSSELLHRGRLPLICEAISLVREASGDELVISGVIPGPYTLLLYLVEPGRLFSDMKRDPASVQSALAHLTEFLAGVGRAYRDAGADLLTIHDMGGSPGFIGPGKYEEFVYPAERQLIGELPGPRVLSVCGNPNKALHLLAQTGAEAVSLDQSADLKAAREAFTDVLLFGDIDPVGVLWQGDPARVAEAARRAREGGVDAVWPGCDLVPATPIQNIASMLKA